MLQFDIHILTLKIFVYNLMQFSSCKTNIVKYIRCIFNLREKQLLSIFRNTTRNSLTNLHNIETKKI